MTRLDMGTRSCMVETLADWYEQLQHEGAEPRARVCTAHAVHRLCKVWLRSVHPGMMPGTNRHVRLGGVAVVTTGLRIGCCCFPPPPTKGETSLRQLRIAQPRDMGRETRSTTAARSVK